MKTNIDDVAQTLAEYERLAITSGAVVQIDPPEFSADGDTFAPFWIDDEPPKLARSTVYRDGVPTTVYVAWDEAVPLETAMTEDGRRWLDLWIERPMQRFGSYAVRSSLRRAFREVVGERVEPDEDAPKVAGAQAPAPERDWDDEIASAPTEERLIEVWAEARASRARTAAREVAYRARLEQLTADGWEPAPAQKPGRAPSDHRPPANRAARRAKTRKKGRR
ncbi:hypothetical protein [Microbacterium oleivorans]|uniref:Uncharacterized protein n=1 Tax=Microbacterium oleivorans TaxID=273677 RepID=A0A4R5YFD8_9MICO|nr:hypothetical protein [Microbacterium oleivorans]TDL43862.1 hypothetical protein E2R54_11775 [Microbacterium oleivorans]